MSQDIRVGLVPLDRIDFHRHNVREDLGDLRDLTESIRQLGVLQPVVVEVRGERLRVRAGHRRVAAARLAGLTKIPAVVHGAALEDDQWLVAAVHENTRRRNLDRADRERTVRAMRAAGMTWQGIGAAFGVSETAVRGWVAPETAHAPETRRYSVHTSTLRTFVARARQHVTAGSWSASDVLDALDTVAETGTITSALGGAA